MEITEKYLIDNDYLRRDVYYDKQLSYSLFRKEISPYFDTMTYIQFFKKNNGLDTVKECSIGTGISKSLLRNFVVGDRCVNYVSELLSLENELRIT